jgi:hypothetical protein
MMYAVEAAASKCNHDSRDIVAQCLQYLHTEFTGMTEVDLNKFYDGTNARFGVMNNDKEFKHRLLAWYNVKGFGGGAGTVMKSLWYENEVR